MMGMEEATWKVLIAHGGSSSPKLCTFHTGAGGVLCSDQKHPDHPASPGVSVCEDKH